jgi:hypothetical protein
MKKLISENLFHESLDDKDPFFFNFLYVENSEIINYLVHFFLLHFIFYFYIYR